MRQEKIYAEAAEIPTETIGTGCGLVTGLSGAEKNY